MTHPRVFQPPTPSRVALEQIEAWLESPSLVLLAESAGYLQVLSNTIAESGVVGRAVHDARIAALCQHHGVTRLYTADRDFSRFTRLRTLNPLVSTS